MIYFFFYGLLLYGHLALCIYGVINWQMLHYFMRSICLKAQLASICYAVLFAIPPQVPTLGGYEQEKRVAYGYQPGHYADTEFDFYISSFALCNNELMHWSGLIIGEGVGWLSHNPYCGVNSLDFNIRCGLVMTCSSSLPAYCCRGFFLGRRAYITGCLPLLPLGYGG